MKLDFSNILEIHKGVRIEVADRDCRLYYYELQHGEDWSIPMTVEKKVRVNYWGAIVCREPIRLSEKDYINIDKEDRERLSIMTNPDKNTPVTITQWMEENGIVDAANSRFTTTGYFWDCECKENYIRPQTERKCPSCGADEEDMPSSRTDEVIEMLIKEARG